MRILKSVLLRTIIGVSSSILKLMIYCKLYRSISSGSSETLNFCSYWRVILDGIACEPSHARCWNVQAIASFITDTDKPTRSEKIATPELSNSNVFKITVYVWGWGCSKFVLAVEVCTLCSAAPLERNDHLLWASCKLISLLNGAIDNLLVIYVLFTTIYSYFIFSTLLDAIKMWK